MASSDSQEFESADEAGSLDGGEKRSRRRSKKSSSNYDSEDATSADKNTKTHVSSVSSAVPKFVPAENTTTDGWDDFEIEEDNSNATVIIPVVKSEKLSTGSKEKPIERCEKSQERKCEKQETKAVLPKQESSDGWDKFDDWGDDSSSEPPQVDSPRNSEDEKIHSVADHLSTTTSGVSDGGWGWRWGGSLLTTATASLSTLTDTVSQGLSTVTNVLESGIGIPEPEDLARRTQPSSDTAASECTESGSSTGTDHANGRGSSDAGFAFGSLITGVSQITKFVEHTGSAVISGGLDTLETIGKKTMEVLQADDPRLEKKRAMLGLNTQDKIILSQVLREAKSRADEEDKIREQKKQAKEVHYETLFDDFEGLVHLEALEMLSKQTSMRLEERLRAASADKRKDMHETMQQVAELCEGDCDDEIDDVATDKQLSSAETLYNRLREATQDSGVTLQFQPLLKQYEDSLAWLASPEAATPRGVYARGVSSLAQCTALSVHIYHKAAELLLISARSSTADEADALSQMTSVLKRHVTELATQFTQHLDTIEVEDKEKVDEYITSLFLEAGNSSTYIQNAFELIVPILQIGAV